MVCRTSLSVLPENGPSEARARLRLYDRHRRRNVSEVGKPLRLFVARDCFRGEIKQVGVVRADGLDRNPLYAAAMRS